MKKFPNRASFIFICIAVALCFAPNVNALADEWWNAAWHYRIKVEINATDYDRNATPIEVGVNFTSELNSLGNYDAFDNNSIRVVEYDSSGNALYEIPSQFDADSTYDALQNALGQVVWIMNGTTPAGTLRYYYIYYDTENKTEKNYQTNLTYSFYNGEIYVNTTKLEIKIDTNRSETTSGIYYARRRDSGVTIFDRPSTERTVEYLQYYNGTYFGFDLVNNASFTYGPIRLIVEQRGNEIVWNNVSQPAEGYIVKRYTFYSDTPWIKIEHVFKNNASYAIDRWSDGPSALDLDADRAFGMDAVQGSATDPYSWYSAYSNLGMGLGIINAMENHTINFYANYDLLNGKIGIQLDNTTISPGGNISEEAVVYFNDQASHTPVQNLRDRLANPVSKNVSTAEKYNFNILAATDFNVYNRGEIAVITGNVTQNDHNISFSVNATLDKGTLGTSDDITIRLYDDGTHGDLVAGDNVYTGNYTILDNDTAGPWNITVYAYDSSGYYINSSLATINLSDYYNLNLTIPDDLVLTENVVYANLTIKNYRNDTFIDYASVSCRYDTTSDTNITELGNGKYAINFTAPSSPGNYTLVCNATKNNNSGSDFSYFQAESHTTNILVDMEPFILYANNITLYHNQTFEINVSLNNTGNGTAYYTNITFLLPSNWSINPIYGSCGNLSVSSSCTKYFNVTIPENTSPQNFTITAHGNWTNPDSTQNSSYDISTVIVSSNPILNMLETSREKTINEGESSLVNFTVKSVGNDVVENITMSCISGEACTNFTVVFIPDNISNLSVGSEYIVFANISVPEGYPNGTYTGILNVSSSNGGYDSLTLNVTVPKSYTWTMSPENCSHTVLPDKNGTVCQVMINATGNQPLNFTIDPGSANYTSIENTSFFINSQSSFSFLVFYDTNNASAGNYVSDYNVSPSYGSIAGAPATRNLTVNLTVVLGPLLESLVVGQGKQMEKFDIRLKISDLSSSGIKFANATIITPSGNEYNISLVNVTPNTPGSTSIWSYNLSNTSQRGIYNVSFLVYDNQNGFAVLDGVSFKIYAKLNITLNTKWNVYYAGEIPSINYNLTDGIGTPLIANASIKVFTSDGFLIFNQSYRTNENGTFSVLPSFQIPTDAVVGNYRLVSETDYFDNYVNTTITKNVTYAFSVTRRVYVELDTSLVTYPQNTLKFYILVYADAKIDAPNITLTVYDPLNNLFLSAEKGTMVLINQTNSSYIYASEHLLPSNVSLGTYLAVLDVQQGNRHIEKLKSFRVSSGGPYDVVISSISPEVEQGKYLNFTILIENMGELGQDVYLDYWISDGNQTYDGVSGEAVYVAANDSRSFNRHLFVYASQPIGKYYLNVKMTYSSLQPTISVNRTFNVVVPSAPPQQNESKPSGGGVSAPIAGIVSAKEEIYKINISAMYPEKIEVETGGTRYLTIQIKNTGNVELKDIYVDILGIPNNWFKRIGRVSDLGAGKTGVQIIRFEMPENAEIKTYEAKVKVSTDRVQDERPVKIIVYKTRKDLLASMIEEVKKELKETEIRAYQASLERNITNVIELMERANYLIKEADDFLKSDNFVATEERINKAKNILERANYELSKTTPKTILLLPFNSAILIALFLITLMFILTFYSRRRREESQNLEKLRKNITGKEKEIIDVQDVVLQRKREIIELLKTIDEQFAKGIISKRTYLELKKKYEKELSNMKIKVCKACGAPNEYDAEYCTRCGEKL